MKNRYVKFILLYITTSSLWNVLTLECLYFSLFLQQPSEYTTLWIKLILKVKIIFIEGYVIDTMIPILTHLILTIMLKCMWLLLLSSFLWMMEPRHREMKQFAWHHTVSIGQSQKPNSEKLVLASTLVTIKCYNADLTYFYSQFTKQNLKRKVAKCCCCYTAIKGRNGTKVCCLILNLRNIITVHGLLWLKCKICVTFYLANWEIKQG